VPVPPDKPRIHQIRLADLPALRARVEELGRDDPQCTEKLLGQLAGMEAGREQRDPEEILLFVPVRDCRDLADRAVADLHGAATIAEGRFSRASARRAATHFRRHLDD
jgi:hypothetical protein